MALVVVGWKLSDDETCAQCGQVARVIVEEDGIEVYPACHDCVQPGTVRDRIAEVLEKALRQSESD